MILKVNNINSMKQIQPLLQSGCSLIRPNVFSLLSESEEVNITAYNTLVRAYPSNKLVFPLNTWEDTEAFLEAFLEQDIHADYIEFNNLNSYPFSQDDNLSLLAEALKKWDKRLIISGLSASYDFPVEITQLFSFLPVFNEALGKFFKERTLCYEYEINPNAGNPWQMLSQDSKTYPDEMQIEDVLEGTSLNPLLLSFNFTQSNLLEIYTCFNQTAKGFTWHLPSADRRYGEDFSTVEFDDVLAHIGMIKSWNEIADDDFELSSLNIEVHCPTCGNEMVHDSNSLRLAESPTGAVLECGKCDEITDWKFIGVPIKTIQVPVQFGGNV